MAHQANAIALSMNDLRAVSRFAAECAAVIEVLRRYPTAPAGGGRVGALLRELDGVLRSTA